MATKVKQHRRRTRKGYVTVHSHYRVSSGKPKRHTKRAKLWRRYKQEAYYSAWDNDNYRWLSSGSNSKTKREAIKDAFEMMIESGDVDDEDYHKLKEMSLRDKEAYLDEVANIKIQKHRGKIADNGDDYDD